MNEEVQKVLDVIGGPLPTCSIYNLKPNSVTFCRKSIFTIPDTPENLFVVLSRGVIHQGWAIPIYVDITEWTFWNYHNWYWEGKPDPLYDAYNTTVIVGVPGIGRIYNGNEYIDPIHIGYVQTGRNIKIESSSVVHRGVLDNTIIGNDVVIGALNNIGHNAIIGDRTIITSNVAIGGSAKIGADCYIGMGAVIRDNITICDGAYIGIGSVVTKDINKRGKWYGNPARYVQ